MKNSFETPADTRQSLNTKFDRDLFAEAHSHTAMILPRTETHSDLFPSDLPAKLQYPLDTIANLGIAQPEILKARRELDAQGADPLKTLPTIMQNVRVLGMGETHIAPNPQREVGAESMEDLKRAGATHLAIEMDQARQPVLDKYMATGELNPKDLPEKLQTPDYRKMLDSARAAGLKINAVDDHFAEEFLHINRNRVMAGYIGQILDQSPQNKVVFWVGSAHLTRFSDGQKSDDGQSSAQILSQKYPVATVLAEARLHTERAPLESITADLTRPVMLKTSLTPHLAALREDSLTKPKTWLKNYDYVIDFPEVSKPQS